MWMRHHPQALKPLARSGACMQACRTQAALGANRWRVMGELPQSKMKTEGSQSSSRGLQCVHWQSSHVHELHVTREDSVCFAGLGTLSLNIESLVKLHHGKNTENKAKAGRHVRLTSLVMNSCCRLPVRATRALEAYFARLQRLRD